MRYTLAMSKSSTSFVSLRLDAELVKRLDAMAEREKLTRTAVIERLAWREFTAAKFTGPVSMLKKVAQAVEPVEGDPVVEWLFCGPVDFGKKGGKHGAR